MELIFEFGQVVKEMSFKDISIFSYEFCSAELNCLCNFRRGHL